MQHFAVFIHDFIRNWFISIIISLNVSESVLIGSEFGVVLQYGLQLLAQHYIPFDFQLASEERLWRNGRER